MDFAGITVLITGGASGIGKATVMQLSRAGASVICADIDERKARHLSRRKKSGAAIDFEPIDLTDGVEYGLRGRCARAHPKIDILINAAGFGEFHFFVDTPPDYIDKVGRGNLTGASILRRRCCRRSLAIAVADSQRLERRRQGRVHGRNCLCGGEGRLDRFHQVAGARSGALQHQRQLHLPGPDRYAAAQTRSDSLRKSSSRQSPSAASASRTRSPMPSSFSPARSPNTLPDRC